MLRAKTLLQDLATVADRSGRDLELLGRFFKTGKGQYAEGDQFIGVRVPALRIICKKYYNMSLSEIEKALESPIHEMRLAAVIIMAEQARGEDGTHKKALYDLYLRRSDRVNNWDIVDSSAAQVVGAYLWDRPRDILYQLAHSKSIWERRIAIISTFWFIRQGQLDDTFALAKILLKDTHDLIHKAVGWMLREAGKRDQAALQRFLDAHAGAMPRTMLRYAIEKFPPAIRAVYLAK